MSKFLKSISIFGSTASALQIVGNLLSLFLVGGGGILTYFTAEEAPLLEALGPAGWIVFSIAVSLLIAIVLWIMSAVNKQNAQTRYLDLMSLRDGQLNPVATSFEDRIIHPVDLQLPTRSMHKSKRFERCIFAGPGAIFIIGGRVENCSFSDNGDMIAVEPCTITGIPVLEDCIFINCEFVRTTVLCNQGSGRSFQKVGAKVVGLIDANDTE